jgi:hypothetical protein
VGELSAVVDFTAEGLMNAAAAEAALDDFGDEPFEEGLAVYLGAAHREAGLTEMGVQIVRDGIVRVLVNRLRYFEDLKRHPEIAEEQIVAPIVVTGLGRTGTTKLQRMMASDPEVQSPRTWRMLNPARFPGATSDAQDPRIAVARQFEELLAEAAPDFIAAHAPEAMEADEESYLLDMTFDCLFPRFRTFVPSFATWLAQRSGENAYRFLLRMMQYLQWQDGGQRGRPWILKSPLHLGNLAHLAKIFPDATIVHCHRDLNVALPSWCRMVETFRQLLADPDPLAIGAEMLDVFSNEMAKYVHDRALLTRSGETRIVDASYRDIVANTVGVIERVYAVHGRVVSDAARAAFAQWEATHPPGRHGSHIYSLQRYGLTEEMVAHAFAPYLAQFA